MKEIVKINESQLQNLISEAVKRVLNEGMTSDNPLFNKWFEAKEILGADQMLDAIWNYLDASQIEKIIGWLDDDYELWNDEEDDEELLEVVVFVLVVAVDVPFEPHAVIIAATASAMILNLMYFIDL